MPGSKVSQSLVYIAIVLTMMACSNAEQATSDAPQPSTPDIQSLDQSWTSFSPGGATTCSDGSPYKFWVRQGNPEKLMVYLQGGGACWFRENCDPQMQPTYTMSIPANFQPWEFGAFNTKNPDNPFADYSVVYAPYCTGDVHLGAKDTIYDPVEEGQKALTIHHQGRTNMQAVLDWTYAHVPNPEQIFVTGSSAGAIPSPFYAAIVADHYPAAQVAQLGDGAGGYRRINADSRPDRQWGTFDFLHDEKGFEGLDETQFNYENLYIAAAQAHPEITFAEYDAAEDAVQKRFLALSGSKDVALLEALQANHADILAAVPNFRSFISGGTSHTILGRPEFYAYGVGTQSVHQWVSSLANFEEVANVSCSDCAKDTFAGPELPAALAKLWDSWEDRKTQYVEPFQIFDNVYYVGIDWVAAYVIKTSEGLILVDSLYGSWIRPLVANMVKLGLDPTQVKYVINTHGHFDHAGGSAFFQQAYGATVVMAEPDWQLASIKAELPMFYMTAPSQAQGIVANDGDVIELGDTKIELFRTPGHTEGVLSLRYLVHDGDAAYTAITLGGVGLNFSGVERTETYLASYHRLQGIAQGVSVSLPNHAAMAQVLQRGQRLKSREAGDPHPFVDPQGYQQSLSTFIARAQEKLVAEKSGTATDPLEELTRAIKD